MLMTLFISTLAAGAQPARTPPPAPPTIRRPVPRQAAPTPAIDRRSFEQGLRASSGGPVFVAIERHFPEDGVLLMDRLYNLVISNRGSLTTAMQQAINEMDRYGRSKARHIVNAPTPNLVALNRRMLSAYQMLRQRDVETCARMATGEGTMSPREAVNLSGTEMTELSVAMIETAGIGSRTPETLGRGQLNQDHLVAWMLEMERLDPDGDQRALLESPERLRAATSVQKCNVGILIHQAVASMQPEAGASIFAFIFAQGLREQGSTQQ